MQLEIVINREAAHPQAVVVDAAEAAARPPTTVAWRVLGVPASALRLRLVAANISVTGAAADAAGPIHQQPLSAADLRLGSWQLPAAVLHSPQLFEISVCGRAEWTEARAVLAATGAATQPHTQHSPVCGRGRLLVVDSSQTAGRAAWIGGGTQMRSEFKLQPRTANAPVTQANVLASGLGCFRLTVNGQPANASTFLEPGWNFLPSRRVLYRVYDVAALLNSSSPTQVLGARLGMCKFGYLGAFCVGAHAAHSVCRALLLELNITFADGSTQTVATQSGGEWLVTTAANPIRYSHLYHGEIFDESLNDLGWDRPGGLRNVSQWAPAAPAVFVNGAGQPPVGADKALGQLSLHAFPPMAATEQHLPVGISNISLPLAGLTQCGPQTLVSEVLEGQQMELACAAGQTMQTVEDAFFAQPGAEVGGRFVGGTVGAACADPAFPVGCLFWQDYASQMKYFVKDCVAAPCGVNACEAYVPIGAGILSIPTGPTDFNCTLAECGKQQPGPCLVGDAAAVVAGRCVGQARCTIPATVATFGGNDPCPLVVKVLRVRMGGCAAGTRTAYVFDFGQNMAGVARLQLPATKTRFQLLLKYCEVLKPDGSCDMAWCNGEGPQCTQGGLNSANQTDAYLSQPGVPTDYTPSFTYHGFRYVQVEGWPDELPPPAALPTPALTALFVHSDVGRRTNSSLWFSREEMGLLNRIQTAVSYTQASNLHSHATDCPTREKRGWTGDSQLSAAAVILNFARIAGLYENWLQTMSDHTAVGCASGAAAPVWPQENVDICCDPAKPTFGCSYEGVPGGAFGNRTVGAVADVVPFTYVGGWPGDPSWGAIGAVLPYELLVGAGDQQAASRFYASVVKPLAEFFISNADPAAGGLVRFGYYGDWLSLESVEKEQVTSASFLMVLHHAEAVARAVGATSDAARYSALFASGRHAYNTRYLGASGYAGGAQTANALPLWLGLVEAADVGPVAAALVADVEQRQGAVSSGIVGAAYVLGAVAGAQVGRSDLALAMALKDNSTSWGFMVEKGPGTIWEAWDDSTNSHNHPALGAGIGRYLWRLAGLGAGTAEAGVEWGGGGFGGVFEDGRATWKTVGGARVCGWAGAGPGLEGCLEWQWDEQACRFEAIVELPHDMRLGQAGGVIVRVPRVGSGAVTLDLWACSGAEESSKQPDNASCGWAGGFGLHELQLERLAWTGVRKLEGEEELQFSVGLRFASGGRFRLRVM